MKSERSVIEKNLLIGKHSFSPAGLCVTGGADEEGGRGGETAGARSAEAAATASSGATTSLMAYSYLYLATLLFLLLYLIGSIFE